MNNPFNNNCQHNKSNIINCFGDEVRNNIVQYQLKHEVGAKLEVTLEDNTNTLIDLLSKSGDLISRITIPVSSITSIRFNEDTMVLEIEDSYGKITTCDLSPILDNIQTATTEDILNLYN